MHFTIFVRISKTFPCAAERTSERAVAFTALFACTSFGWHAIRHACHTDNIKL